MPTSRMKPQTGRHGPLYCLLLGAVLCQASCAATDEQSRKLSKAATPPAPEAVAGASAATVAMSPATPSNPAPADEDQPAKIRLSLVSHAADDADDRAPSRGNQAAEPKSESASDVSASPPAATPEPNGELQVKEAPAEETDRPLPISLAAALRLSEARPLVIAAAQASAWVAEAQLQRAEVLWVPTLNMGADYIRHDGFGPDFNRGINTEARPLNQNINFLYTGAGITQSVAMTDAIFEPLAARQVLASRRFDIQAGKNDALLATAKAYFDVHQHRGQYAGTLDVVERGHKLVERISQLSEDLVPQVEAHRAKRQLAAIEQRAVLARQEWRVSSANLTLVLRLDPRVVVEPAEHDHLQITLIDPARTLDELIPIGLTNRPELASQKALADAVAQRIRREKGRILMPTMMLNGFQTPSELLQVGAQGIGNDGKLNLWSVRDDFSPQILWQLEGMGLGNHARIKEQRGEQSRAIIELFKAQDAVAADVTRSQARLQSAAARVVQAERSLREAIITYDGNFEGLRQTKRFENVLVQIYRPQEAVIALDDLMLAYDQYFSTVADYNRAQFEVFHALGYPAKEVAALRPPGEEGPVDTTRPEYLPPVGEGPPPATR